MEELLAEIEEWNETRLSNDLQEIVKIASVSGEEQQLAHYLHERFTTLGLQSEIDRHGNVIARLIGAHPGPRIVLNSHMDTVGYGNGWTYDPLGAEIKDGRLYGRGSCDCKASIVTHILAAEQLVGRTQELHGELIITHVVEEEVQNEARKGTFKLLEDGFEADMAVNGEAIDMNIGLACGGMVELVVTTYGKRAHGSTPKEGVNAITSMFALASDLLKLEPGHHPYTGEGSIVLGVIEGGERSSVVPDECRLKVSRFIVPGEKGEDFLAEVEHIIEERKRQDASFQAKVEMTYVSKPALTDENEPIVLGLTKAMETLGLPVTYSGTPQHNDADYLVNKGGIPTVIYGPGRIRLGHVPDEYVDLSEVVTAAKVLTLALYQVLTRSV
ncbi:M20 family metallopeptidase [Shouchella clausii]|uniref:M20 family metallopeptidase n=1 Tax=Shouchella clausii TaxID=79880 RepID=UPI000791AF3B|nr:M20 family metallopeptidase [Shouchella clausii]KKI85123.1 hypothetical protein WZ76_16845 [Shouchella clausii]